MAFMAGAGIALAQSAATGSGASADGEGIRISMSSFLNTIDSLAVAALTTLDLGCGQPFDFVARRHEALHDGGEAWFGGLTAAPGG